jgi:HD-GYP domain-containing protein (c-di-GMP phosphodiesterase class II)
MTASLERRLAKLQSILEVAKAMTVERNLDRLLALINDEAAKVAEADRCSIFLVDRDRSELWSKVAHGTQEIRIPLGTGIAGAVAARGEVVRIADAYADPRFNKKVDADTGYRTHSILCVPMWNTKREVTGVLQALNRRDGDFTEEDAELLVALGGQAASAIENAVLNAEIERLFEGFVKASVVAIEQRDPTTAGHSGRVATLTVGLARAVEKAPPPNWKDARFDAASIQQMRYAALLHDFGKVGVREHVLVKADKLYPQELELLRARFDVIRSQLDREGLQHRLDGRDPASVAERVAELDRFWEIIVASNRPTVLPAEASAALHEIAKKSFLDPRGEQRPYLTPTEVSLLSIPKGSLSDGERLEIESHVTHTYNFLQQIPWTRTLKRVPEIAYGHHEKLDGKGYPRHVPGGEIAVETRMMTISDIYDALTASDRPYKKAMPAERAIDILKDEAKRGQVDVTLLDVFVAAGVWKETVKG